MANSDINPLADGLVYEDLLPLSWAARSEESNYTRVAEHNEHVLRCANLLGEQIREKTDEESEAESALMRLDSKVNLLLELVSKLNQRTNMIPNATDVRLGAAGVEWKCQGMPPQIGSNIWIELYLDNRIPEAMKIPATVLTLYEEGQGSTVSARFEGLGDIVRDQMEKMIFRHHRRRVAQARSS